VSLRRLQAAPQAGPPGRDPYFDNVKYLAIVLVACGHAWVPFCGESRTVLALYDLVYTVHMPVFVLVSGYFSRGFDCSPRKVDRLITGVLVPYLGFEVLYTCFRWWAGGDPDAALSILDPWFLDWFLLALFVWRLTTPLWRRVRRPVVVSVAVSVIAAVSPDLGGTLSMQRVLQFLPFFVLGTVARPEHFAWVRRREVRAAALAVGTAALGFAYWAAPRLDRAWFWRSEAGRDLGVSAPASALMALALFGASFVLVACFLAWVPARTTWFTKLGAGTLYGYLLHGFLVKGSLYWGWYEPDWVGTPAGTVLVTVCAAVIVTLLCTDPVRRAFRPLVEPRVRRLLRDRAGADVVVCNRSPSP
jgi:fucose 4-O-acetylase-like acetyltransferase